MVVVQLIILYTYCIYLEGVELFVYLEVYVKTYVSRFINYTTHVGVANEFISKDSSHFSCYYKCW